MCKHVWNFFKDLIRGIHAGLVHSSGLLEVRGSCLEQDTSLDDTFVVFIAPPHQKNASIVPQIGHGPFLPYHLQLSQIILPSATTYFEVLTATLNKQ